MNRLKVVDIFFSLSSLDANSFYIEKHAVSGSSQFSQNITLTDGWEGPVTIFSLPSICELVPVAAVSFLNPVLNRVLKAETVPRWPRVLP